MTRRQYKVIIAALTMLMALGGVVIGVLFPNSVALGIIIMGIITVTPMLLLHKFVEEPIEDERDKENLGRAAKWAISAYMWLVVVIGIALLGLSNNNPQYRANILQTFYSIIVLTSIYSLIYRYNEKQKYTDPYLIIIAIVTVYFTYSFISSLLLL